MLAELSYYCFMGTAKKKCFSMVFTRHGKNDTCLDLPTSSYICVSVLGF